MSEGLRQPPPPHHPASVTAEGPSGDLELPLLHNRPLLLYNLLGDEARGKIHGVNSNFLFPIHAQPSMVIEMALQLTRKCCDTKMPVVDLYFWTWTMVRVSQVQIYFSSAVDKEKKKKTSEWHIWPEIRLQSPSHALSWNAANAVAIMLWENLPKCERVNYPNTCFEKFIFSFRSISKYSFQ